MTSHDHEKKTTKGVIRNDLETAKDYTTVILSNAQPQKTVFNIQNNGQQFFFPVLIFTRHLLLLH